ncbi:YibE/F family protein [Saccharopolyspora mangrovi]|uniref:YibE/F family protein n=1 Tax=Saccharopolyspora mangrovi TaxID=3082379 RepID=A0ABU6A7Y9_9PSEU|nr:YibE/F family protein [Saccharopolyspora sp. S2-29]MEB3367625.1 YibE/F family protein [Saccharopolyspora sp. S2-29]
MTEPPEIPGRRPRHRQPGQGAWQPPPPQQPGRRPPQPGDNQTPRENPPPRQGPPQRPEPQRTRPPRPQPAPTPESPEEPRSHRRRDEPAGHGHGHGHGPATPASKQVKRLLAALLIPFALAAIVGVLVLYPWGHHQKTGADLGFGQYPVNGEVVSAGATSCNEGETGQGCVQLAVKMQDGPRPNQTIEQVMPTDPGTPRFAVGDQVVLSYAGDNPDEPTSFQVVDFQRGTPLTVLALVFAAAVLVLGRWQGLAALVGLGLSLVMLVGFVLPAILAGEDPLLVAVVGAGLIMFIVLYLTHGFSARTSTAVLGTLLSLALIGLLSSAFSAATSLTGLDENTSSLMGALGAPIDARGLLLAGIVIGALGVLDDVTVTQTSAVWELRAANPTLSWRQLYGAGLRIGRDHVSSAVNTLVLAYAGAALPMLLAYTLSGRTFGQIVSSQAVAQEVVRTLVGSVGLVAAVPITTAIAALVAVQEPAERSGDGGAERAKRRRRPGKPGGR